MWLEPVPLRNKLYVNLTWGSWGGQPLLWERQAPLSSLQRWRRRFWVRFIESRNIMLFYFTLSGKPVHSLMLFSHLFFCPLILPPYAVPCSIVWQVLLIFCLFTVDRWFWQYQIQHFWSGVRFLPQKKKKNQKCTCVTLCVCVRVRVCVCACLPSFAFAFAISKWEPLALSSLCLSAHKGLCQAKHCDLCVIVIVFVWHRNMSPFWQILGS